MDPLDPLTEIIYSGQGFSPAIALERIIWAMIGIFFFCLLYTSDAADESDRVDLGGRRIIKKIF